MKLRSRLEGVRIPDGGSTDVDCEECGTYQLNSETVVTGNGDAILTRHGDNTTAIVLKNTLRRRAVEIKVNKKAVSNICWALSSIASSLD